LQKASEEFTEGLEFLKKDTHFDKIRVKFTCKLNEGLGHLWCEPLLFDRCEEHLGKAEDLYDQYDKLFTEQDHIKFLIKKSSFLKKFGFFGDALDLLECMQRDLMELLKSP
jgi:hypothetical protein